ncbi:ice-binding family protein, partial [Actinomadura sp. NPDC049753]|uniref:ice-binding family protein n=1 Tax=Actinomadura sp. NPDC049753 TaxID=3154739 RepID=UPI003429AEC8
MLSCLAAGVACILGVAIFVALQSRARAAQAPVDLGTASSFAVLAGTTVTNTGPSVINGDLGVSPGTAITGFPPGTVNGVQHSADAVALQAQTDLTAAYNDAAGRTPPISVSGDLGGQTLVPGVYQSTSSLGLTGTVTLDGQNDPNAVFIFQISSTLITASGSVVALVNGAQPCNVFWQVGSSATLGTNSTFVGNILALQSISVNTGTIIDGRALARNGAVTLDSNTITRSTCTTPTPTPTVTAPTPTPTVTAPTPTPTVTAPTPTPTVTAPTPTPTVTAPTPTPTVTAPTPTPTVTAPTPTPTVT